MPWPARLSKMDLASAERRVPGPKAGLLRAHMEGNAIGLEAQRMGMQQHFGRHFRVAAELAAQRPFGPGAIGEDAAEYPRCRCGAPNFFDFFNAIDREHRNAKLMRPGDVALFLDGIAKGNPLRRGAGGQRHLDFGNACRIEAGAKARQKLQHFRGRVCLYRIKNTRVRHGPRKGFVIVSDDLKIDDEARAFWSSVAEEVQNAGGCGHVRISQKKLRHQSAL